MPRPGPTWLLTLLLAPLLAHAGCAIGSTTTERPAINRPAIGPDGAFWDAVDAANRGSVEAFRFQVSPRFLHEGVLPREKRNEPNSTESFDLERQRLEKQLEPYAGTVDRMLRSYMEHLRNLTSNRFIDVGRPSYEIKYHDDFDRAAGPNRATVEISIWSKKAMGPADKPDKFTVTFVQDRQRWLIDDITPNPLKGAFTR